MDLPADSRSYIPASNRNALLVTEGVGRSGMNYDLAVISAHYASIFF
jgi:hypothetical protein